MHERRVNNIFLRGAQGIGKSTLIDRVLLSLSKTKGFTVGGLMTFRNPDDDKIYITEAAFPRDYSCAALIGHRSTGVVPGVFEMYAQLLLKPVSNSDIIVLDELGFLEQDSILFQNAVIKCLESDTPVLGVLKNKEIPWYHKVLERDDVSVIDIIIENREQIWPELTGIILQKLLHRGCQ